MKKIKQFFQSFEEELIISRKLLFFEILTALFGGILIGFIFAPSRTVTIGSNNGSNNENNGNGNALPEDEQAIDKN